jgi:hypothetical protein
VSPIQMKMNSTVLSTLYPTIHHNLVIVVGGYGSGKSEISVNLARLLATSGSTPVALADLDIVNPYFRSREAAEKLASFGVRSLVPHGTQVYADLPVVIPDIKREIENRVGWLILDIGGDDVGARVLSSLTESISPLSYDMLFVVNERRPFTSDVARAMKVMKEIEVSSRFRFTGLIANTHLMTETTAEIVLAGIDMARHLSAKTGLAISFASVEKSVLSGMTRQQIGLPILELDRALVKPWEHVGNTWTDKKLRIH